MAEADVAELLAGVEMNEARFLSILSQVVGESRVLQNCPPLGLVPREDAASDHVLRALEPYSTACGGPLEVQRVSFVPGRGNVIIRYPGTTDRVCSFIGSHLDVVPADPKGWSRDPFQLIVEGDNLYGRGTTDCLGHVAMLTDMMISLAERRVPLKTTIVVIFIANEENSAFVGVGVDQLAREGHLEQLKRGPVFWIDAADSHPCIGTAGNIQWEIKAIGKLFHSGMPHKGINAIELGTDALCYLQKRFFQDFPRQQVETDYNFATQSTMKPTQISCAPGALNQLPPVCTIQGDIRLAPFYFMKDVKEAVERYVAELSADLSVLESPAVHGPHSKYSLPGEPEVGKLEFRWIGNGENGVACKLDSKGHVALLKATKDVLGEVAPYSIGGSLPLIRDLQDQGFDVQISGYGISARYHADNECAKLTDMKNACRILARVIADLNV